MQKVTWKRGKSQSSIIKFRSFIFLPLEISDNKLGDSLTK